ncbi:MAG: hypothetical protein HYV07_10210 [Deltaproteobacteria bacterium]|nr:hypothetical protein [Deltaproteobacteria bacterium]
MRKLGCCLCGALCLVLFSSTAVWGQEEVREKDEARYAKRTVIELSELTITGHAVGPGGVYLTSKRRARFVPRLKLRTSFLPELVVSIDQAE